MMQARRLMPDRKDPNSMTRLPTNGKGPTELCQRPEITITQVICCLRLQASVLVIGQQFVCLGNDFVEGR